MDYFFRCLGRWKDLKRRRSSKRTSGLHPSNELHKPPAPRFLPGDSPENLALQQEVTGGGGSPTEFRKKKVMFDLNVKTYEEFVNIDDPKHSVNVVDGYLIQEKELTNVMDKLKPISCSFPLSHRCRNCESAGEDNVEDEEGDEYWDCNSGEQGDQPGIEEDEEQLCRRFSPISIKKRQGTYHEVSDPNLMHTSLDDKQPTISAKSHTHDWGQYAHSVLNSVENISIRKEFKVHAGSTKNPEKKNINSELNSEKPKKSTNSKLTPSLPTQQEMSLNANLSNWLVSENSTMERPQECYSRHSCSSLSREEQPILGALTVDDIRQSSYASAHRKSLPKNPDEIPILGTVGGYWNFP